VRIAINKAKIPGGSQDKMYGTNPKMLPRFVDTVVSIEPKPGNKALITVFTGQEIT